MDLPAEARSSKSAYTDVSELHPNLLLGTLQLLFWLFVHPSAWRNCVAQIDPTLPPHFCLSELNQVQGQNPALRHLLVRIYLIWPVLMGLVLAGWGITGGSMAYWARFGPTGSVAFGAAFSLVLGLTGGLAVSLAFGLASGVIGSLAFGVASVNPNPEVRTFALVVALGLASGTVSSVIFGTAPVPADRSLVYSSSRQMGGIVVGILIGFVGSMLAGSVALLLARPVILGIAGGIALGVAVGWRTHPRRGWWVGLGFGLIVTCLRLGVVAGTAGLMALSLANAALLVALFALSYTLAGRMAGPWAGAVAGALGSGGFFYSVLGVYFNWPLLLLGITCILLGLTIAWWRPVLLYPFLAAWNFLLYRADEGRVKAHSSLLPRHSAFWDEYQLLPLPGLVEHLVLVAGRDAVEGQAAINYLTTSRQRWAAQAAQIELDARRLECYADVETMGQAHRHLAAGELAGPTSALLRSLSRISQDVEAALQQASVYNRRLALSALEERLDGLLRELTRSSERYALRFQPIVIRWRELVTDYIHVLTEAVELRQEIDSPYIIGLPLTDQQEIFVGRTDISARIEQLLLDRRRPPLLLYGQRRMGKTSLLNNLGRLLPSTIIPLFVDLQGPLVHASDHASFFYNLARSMVHSAQRQRNLALPPPNRDFLAADPFTRFDEWLDDVETVLGANTALLTLDEFEALDTALAAGRLSETAVLGMLRHLIQHRPRFKVILAGSHSPDEFQHWAGYLINVQGVRVSYLNEGEARQLIEQPIKNFALRYESKASQRVLILTRGHPFLVQLLCAEIVTLKNEQPPPTRWLVRLADVEAAVPEALGHGQFFFLDLQHNQAGAAGLTLLRFLASQGEGAVVSRGSLASRLQPPNDLDQTLAKLMQRDIVERADEGYRFQVELIRRWFE